jgi:nucleotide-binding universal stress UspA family protein
MATHGRGAFEHLVLGSVTEKILRHATCPVLTLGTKVSTEPSFPMFRRVLCALDLTAASARTLHVALSLAEENMASVTLLHVLEGMSERAGSQQIEDAFDRLRFHVPPETQAFCSVTERVEEGSAWREVLRVAETTDADLIVMGAHPSGHFDWPFFGATLNHVVREAHCPVLVVRDLTARVGARREASTASALLRHPDAIVF